MRRLALVLLALLFRAPTSFASDEFESWHLFFIQKSLDSNWSLYAELQPRFHYTGGATQGSDFRQLIVRPALLYRVGASSATLGIGYAWAPSPSNVAAYDHRAWQQLQWDGRGRLGHLILRTRFEQRTFVGIPGPSFRARQMIRWLTSFPLGLAISDEFFINLDAKAAGSVRGWEQNRFFVGSHQRLSQNVWVEAGYLNAWVVRAHRDDRKVHALYTFLGWTW